MFDLNTKDLILIYLQGFQELRNENEVPYGVTQRGIIEGIGTDESEINNTLQELKEKDLVNERVKSVLGINRARNVYFLSGSGLKKENEIWDNIKNKKVSIKTPNDFKEIKFKKVKNYISGRNPAIEALKRMQDNKAIDLTELDDASDVFVGRRKELKYLKNQLKDVKQNGVNFILVKGEAGIGKTSLVSKLIPFAKELGFEFLSGTCQSEISDPYLPFKEAFNQYMEEESSRQDGRMAFIGIGQGEKAEDKSIFDANKKKTFYDTTNFIKNLSDRNPLVIFLDDLQWVDRATVDILMYMNNKLDDSPILFLGTYRPEDVSKKHHLMDMKHRLSRKNNVDTLELEPLTYDNTEDTVKSILGKENIPNNFIRIIHDKTDGNPLFIKESIKQMVEDGTVDVDDDIYPKKGEDISTSGLVQNVIQRRINRFDEDTKKVMDIGSVIGGAIPFELLLETSKFDEIDLLDHVDMLIGDQIWEEDPSEEMFYFSHDLIEKTVYEGLRDMKKKLLHKKVAENIKVIYDYKIDEWYSELARHYDEGKDHSKALDYYLKAGEKAEEVYANEDAIKMYERALELADKTEDHDINRCELFETISRAHSLLGHYDKSREYLNDAIELPNTDNKTKAELHRKIAENWTNMGDYEKALNEIEKSLDLAKDDLKLKSDILSNKGWIFIRRSEYSKAKEIFKEGIEYAERSENDESISQAYHNLGTAYNFLKIFEKAKKNLMKAKDIRENNERWDDLAKTLNNLGVLYENINIDKTLEYYNKSLEINEKVGNIAMKNGLLNNIGRVYYYKGKFDKSIKNLTDSLEIRERIGDKYGISLSFVNLGLIYADKGQFDKAIDYHKRSFEIVDELGDNYVKSINLRGLGKIYYLKDELENSYEYYQKAIESSKEGSNKDQTSLSLSYISEYYLGKDQIEKGIEKAKRALEISNEIKTVRENAIAHRILGRLYEEKDKTEKAIENLEISEEKFRSSGFDLELGKTLFYLGKIYANEEDEKSSKCLSEAESIFDKGNMEYWLEIIE